MELSIDSCTAESTSVDIDEDAEEIRFAVTTDGGNEGPECLDSVRVTLDAPPGQRRIVDASTGEEVEVAPAEG